MLHLNSNRVVHLVVSEQLEARDSGHITNGIIVVLFEKLFILKRYQVLVLNPIIDIWPRFTDASVPARVARLEQDTDILLLSIALPSEKPQITVKAFKLRYYLIYILSTNRSCFMEIVPEDPLSPRLYFNKVALVDRNHFSLDNTFFTISCMQEKL